MNGQPISEISGGARRELERRFGERAVFPDDPRYEAVRAVWNGMIDLRPGVLAQPEDPAEVSFLVDMARDAELPLAIRGGGHNVAGLGLCADGLVIDLARMRGATIDPSSGRASAEGGCLLGDIDRVAQQVGLAVPAGVVSHTGIAGLTLGGGVGWLCRRHGLTCDWLRGVEIVTADGECRRIDDASDPDLMWALRGGGGNFGVVTEFTFDTVERGPMLVASAVYPWAQARDAARAWRDFALAMPEDMAMSGAFRRALPSAELPSQLHGELIWAMVMIWAGDHDDGIDAMRPLLEFGRPVRATGPTPTPYVAVQSMVDSYHPHGRRYYEKARYLESLPDEALDLLIQGATEIPGPLSLLEVIHYGGAITRVGDTETAYAHRDIGFAAQTVAGWTDPAADAIQREWARSTLERLSPWARGAAGYVNYLAEEVDPNALHDLYGPNLARLIEVKTHFDPDNLFRRNHNLPPDPRLTTASGRYEVGP